MDETVDVQEQAIGAGSIVALACVAYGRFIDETLFGVDATTLGLGVFAATFAVVALLHGAYGRRDFAVSHALSAVGLGLVALASSVLPMLAGLVLLVGAGSYTARTTIRARNEAAEEREAAPENA